MSTIYKTHAHTLTIVYRSFKGASVVLILSAYLSVRVHKYRVVQKTDTQFYFCDNFSNLAPILTILSLL